MQRLILPILTLFLGTAAVAQDTPPPEAEQPRPVKLMTVTAQSSEVSRVFFGRVKARETVDLAFQVGGQVGFGGFAVGGGYIDGGDYNAVSGVPATSGDTSIWHVGVSYTAGPLAVGLSYAEGDKGAFRITTPCT